MSADSNSIPEPHVNVFEGTIKNGEILLDVPVALPDGTRVEVMPLIRDTARLGMREEDWPTTSEGIATLLMRMEQVEPGWLSPEDDAAWQTALDSQKQSEKADFMKEGEKLGRMWQ
jgi:hypothetical protein